MNIKINKTVKYATCFAIGGVGYGIIEILWRGHTHYTMIMAGGICFVIFSLIAEKMRCAPLVCKAVLGALSVTAVELAFGLIFNKLLGMNVWDYSRLPYNILGQICPLYTAFWGLLSFAFIPVAGFICKKMMGSRRS